MDEDKTELCNEENDKQSYPFFLGTEDKEEQKNRNMLAVEYTECAVISVMLVVFLVMSVVFPDTVCRITGIIEKIYETGVTEIIKNGIYELTGSEII